MNPPRRRIIMTTDAVGGVWTYATTLARALCAAGDNVTLVTLGPAPTAAQCADIADIEGLLIEVTDLALEWMDPQGADLPRAQTNLRAIVARAAPDLIHLNSYREATFGFTAPVLVAAHSCVGSWWQACRSGVPLTAKWRPYIHNVAAGLDAADCWVAPTRWYSDWIRSAYQPHSRGVVISNGAAIAPGGARKQPFILAAGRMWDEAKGLDVLATAAEAVDWTIRIAGPIRFNEAAGKPSPSRPAYLGVVPHRALIAEMQRAAIFVAPALYEPFGLSVLEAAGCGCALVLSDTGPFRELWEGAALFVPPRDVAAVRAAIEHLCADDTLREKLQRAARARASHYSIERMLAAYRALYNSLIARPALRVAGSLAMEMRR